MKILAFKEEFRQDLKNVFPSAEVDSLFNILTEKFLGMSRLQIALDPQKELSQQEHQDLKAALERLKNHEPVQYITGETEFFGLTFNVNKDVLIPRPETEELIQWILDDFQPRKQEPTKILDIGTGSGCIAIALAKNLPKAEVTAVDISKEALTTAFLNAERNGVQVDFLQQDVLQMEKPAEKFDVIVSNPPYVRELEKEAMQRNVLEYEPQTALYVQNEDSLLFYNKISDLAVEGLTNDGAIYFEINQYLGKETEQLLVRKNFRTTLKKDIFGVDRMLRGKRL